MFPQIRGILAGSAPPRLYFTADIATFTPTATLSSGAPKWTIIESDGTEYTYNTAAISHTRTAAGEFEVYLTPENITGLDMSSCGLACDIGVSGFDLLTSLSGSFYFQSNPNLSGDISALPSGADRYLFYSTSVSGSVADLPSGASYYYFYSTSVSGSVADLPSGASYYHFGSTSVSGSVADLPSGASYYHFGSTSVSGSVADLPSGANYYLFGSTSVSGSVADLPSGASYYYFYSTSVSAGAVAHLTTAFIIDLRDIGWPQADVDTVVASVYTARAVYTNATPELDISGSNAAPSGIYQDATPPTTGKEKIYKLENDPDGEGFNKWGITHS